MSIPENVLSFVIMCGAHIIQTKERIKEGMKKAVAGATRNDMKEPRTRAKDSLTLAYEILILIYQIARCALSLEPQIAIPEEEKKN
jgi:hypothetical protein